MYESSKGGRYDLDLLKFILEISEVSALEEERGCTGYCLVPGSDGLSVIRPAVRPRRTLTGLSLIHI